jgi:hypothetical protein
MLCSVPELADLPDVGVDLVFDEVLIERNLGA